MCSAMVCVEELRLLQVPDVDGIRDDAEALRRARRPRSPSTARGSRGLATRRRPASGPPPRRAWREGRRARAPSAQQGRSAFHSGGSPRPRPARTRVGRPSTSRAGVARAPAQASRAALRAAARVAAGRVLRQRTAAGSRCAPDAPGTSAERRSRRPRCRRGARGGPCRRSAARTDSTARSRVNGPDAPPWPGRSGAITW